MSCQARREGDEVVCGRCGVRWAVGEADACPGNRMVYQGSSKGGLKSRRADDLESLRRPSPAPVYTGEERRRKLREALDSLAKSPGAKWKERK